MRECSLETILEMEHLGLELRTEPGARGPKCDPEALPESKEAVECRDPDPEPEDPGLSLPGL